MAEVKWIKICTDIFDDEKVALIDGMPERDAIIVIWFKLLCMAGRLNNGGVFMLNNKLAYTDEMLATIFRRPLTTVRLALNTFEQFGMVDIINNAYTIPNWEKHQSLDKLEAAKEKNRQRVAAHREKQKLLTECNDYSNVTVTQCNDVDIDKDKEQDKELDNKNISCQQVVDEYHAICKSFPKIRRLTPARSNAIKARLKSYSLDEFKSVFEKAEASSFLKGEDGGWKASFDWLIKEANMVKVLEGNYADKPKHCKRKEPVPGWLPFTMGQAEREAIEQLMKDDSAETVDNNPELAAEAEQLARQMQEKYGRKDAG